MTALQCGIATSVQDVLEAWTLVHDVYVASGHIEPQPESLYLAPGALHRDTLVFNGYREGRLEATLTVIPDSPLGLPPESGFAGELAALRAEARPLVFCGQFVSVVPSRDDLPETRAERADLTMRLFATMAGTLRLRGPDLRLLANPVRRHVGFYRRFLGFEQCGPIRMYGRYRVESALMVTDWLRLRDTPRLPAPIVEALEHPATSAPLPRAVSTATLDTPRMRRHVSEVWGSGAAVWDYVERR